MKRFLFLVALLIISLPTVGDAQGIPIRGSGGTVAEVNTNRAMLMDEGVSTTATYVVHASALALTAEESMLNIEAEAARGFRISQFCINPGQATAAAWIRWQLIRTTTASSGGTVIAAEATVTNSVTKMDPGDANWSGAARTAGTEGTSGAVLDQGTVFVNIAATPPAHGGHIFCREYGLNGGKLPTIVPGTTGTAGGAGASANIRFISCAGTPCI